MLGPLLRHRSSCEHWSQAVKTMVTAIAVCQPSAFCLCIWWVGLYSSLSLYMRQSSQPLKRKLSEQWKHCSPMGCGIWENHRSSCPFCAVMFNPFCAPFRPWRCSCSVLLREMKPKKRLRTKVWKTSFLHFCPGELQDSLNMWFQLYRAEQEECSKKEHQWCLWFGHVEQSALALYAWDTGHKILFDDTTLLCSISSYNKSVLRESLKIRLTEKVMNKEDGAWLSNA